ncbi:hypothetical protein LBMAG42_35480 [Deltaproteobacteria bacterium]|nr:hypothetical protein LBMAG42_35480 [Deltaproteobacteria bacterium]
MILYALLACADTSGGIYGTWNVTDLRLADSDALEGGWSAQVELPETGSGSMSLTLPDEEQAFLLSVEETDADPILQGWADGSLLILHLTCSAAFGAVDCVDSGQIDWSQEDADTHFTVLSLAE